VREAHGFLESGANKVAAACGRLKAAGDVDAALPRPGHGGVAAEREDLADGQRDLPAVALADHVVERSRPCAVAVGAGSTPGEMKMPIVTGIAFW
jgi:hypothetical protein